MINTLLILWREAYALQQYGNFNKEDNPSEANVCIDLQQHVREGRRLKIDGDNLRFFNREIDALLSNSTSRRTTLKE